jgi:hypothetical protein
MRKKINVLNQAVPFFMRCNTLSCSTLLIMVLLTSCGMSDIENQLSEYLKNPKATGVLMVKQLTIDEPTENTDYVCYLQPYQTRVGQYYDKKRPVPIFAQKINKSLATQKFSSIFDGIGNLVFLNKDGSIFIVEMHYYRIPIYPNHRNELYFGKKSGQLIQDCAPFNQAAFDILQANISHYSSTVPEYLWLGLIKTTN